MDVVCGHFMQSDVSRNRGRSFEVGSKFLVINQLTENNDYPGGKKKKRRRL
jgi:hypothetical protein